MPLIIITGAPSSGKTTRTHELKQYFETKHDIRVEIISELETIIKAGYDKNTLFADSRLEKTIRGDVKSNMQRLLNPTDVLIIDGSNYIKGYRYEIYCLSKLYKTPQCTVQCELPIEHAWMWNESRPKDDQYSREIFEALITRYEAPDNKNRWDSPLFVALPEDDLGFDEIYNSLYNVKAPIPNLSTQSPGLSDTNYLYELDKITQEVVNVILAAKQLGIENDIKIPGHVLTVKSSANVVQLTKLRRQFLTYSKMQQTQPNQIASLFVQYLNTTL